MDDLPLLPGESGPKFVDIKVNEIDIPERLRPLDEATVAEYVESIGALGLLHPILVRIRSATGMPELVAGNHRLHAYKRKGLPVIPCRILPDDDDICQIAEIDENLYHRKLTEAEMAMHLVKRADAWERLQAKLGRGVPVSGGRGRTAFAAETARRNPTYNKRSINRHLNRGRKIPPDVLEKISRMPKSINKGEVLDWFARMASYEEQRRVAGLSPEQILAEKGTQPEMFPEADAADDADALHQLKDLVSAWNKASRPARDLFVMKYAWAWKPRTRG